MHYRITGFKVKALVGTFILLNSLAAQAADSDLKVMITSEIASLQVVHRGKKITIQRNQNPENRIAEYLSFTSRKCPPHCIQPIKLPGIETLGELEVIEYLRRIADGDPSVLLVDTRSSEHAAKGTIPGSVNVFGDLLIPERGANPIQVEEILTEQFGVGGSGDDLDFRSAKTLVLFCYGIWCGQGPKTAFALVDLGYPKGKIKWYRGGMQDWESVGLTVVRD